MTYSTVPSNLTGIQPCHLFPSHTCPTGTTKHHAQPFLFKAMREADPSSQPSVVEPLGFAVTSDGKHTGLEQSGPAPVNRSSAISFSWARVIACKFTQAAQSLLLITTSTYHSEVFKIRKEMPASSLSSSPTPLPLTHTHTHTHTPLTSLTTLQFFYWKLWLL